MKSKIAKSSLLLCCVATITHANEWAGAISAQDVRVKVGEVPVIEWNVTYPVRTPEDVVTIDDGVIIPKTDLKMEVRLLGASWGTTTRYYQVAGDLYHNDERSEIFFGHHGKIDPMAIVYDRYVKPDDTIRASAQGSLRPYRHDKRSKVYWSDVINSWENTPNVVLLKNGDDAPQYSPAYEMQHSVEEHLAPYMDSDTGKMTLGPRDLVYLFDFDKFGGWGFWGFDLQDFCVLLTFQDVEPIDDANEPGNGFGNGYNNNGHGNNTDGFDVSNPGVGNTGANDVDYDGDGTYEDDESTSASQENVGW